MTRLTIENRQVAEAWVDRLRIERANTGHLSSASLNEAMSALGRKEKAIRRWVDQGLPSPPGPKGYKLDRGAVSAYHEANGNCKIALRLMERRGLVVPDVRTFQRAVQRDIPLRERVLAKEGPAGASTTTLFLERKELGRGVCWEGDHKQANVLVQKPRGRGSKNLVRPSITMFIDTFSRAIVAVCISVTPTEGEVLSTLAAAMEHHPEFSPAYGIPEVLRIDRGLEFTSNAVTEAATMLGIQVVHTPPYSPHKKGKIERLNRTLIDELFVTMPFFTKGPEKKDGTPAQHKDLKAYPFAVFVDEVLEWCRFYNFERPHSGIGGLTPNERWLADERIINQISPEARQRFTLKRLPNGRVVRGFGIRAFNRNYISADLLDYVGETVEVRHRPHDERSLEIFHDGKHVTTVYPQTEITKEQADEVIRGRRQRAVAQAVRAKKAKKDALIRTAGVVAKGEPEEITIIEPNEFDRVGSSVSQGLLEQLGVQDQQGKKYDRPRKQRKR